MIKRMNVLIVPDEGPVNVAVFAIDRSLKVVVLEPLIVVVP